MIPPAAPKFLTAARASYRFIDETISVDLMDGRIIAVPRVWYPRLLNAISEQRLNWEVWVVATEFTGQILMRI